jgi:hypothetical protein
LINYKKFFFFFLIIHTDNSNIYKARQRGYAYLTALPGMEKGSYALSLSKLKGCFLHSGSRLSSMRSSSMGTMELIVDQLAGIKQGATLTLALLRLQWSFYFVSSTVFGRFILYATSAMTMTEFDLSCMNLCSSAMQDQNKTDKY